MMNRHSNFVDVLEVFGSTRMALNPGRELFTGAIKQKPAPIFPYFCAC
jgi:hypothetical protein